MVFFGGVVGRGARFFLGGDERGVWLLGGGVEVNWSAMYI